MEAIALMLFGGYILFYGILWIWYFFNPKPLKKYIPYSTIGLIILIVILVIALAIDGSLFKDLSVVNYF